MLIYVLPISGGTFPSQLAAMQILCDANQHADIMMGSSGGNMAAYITSAADWTSNGIERVSKSITHEMFLEPWIPVSIINTFFSFFKGSLYHQAGHVVDTLSNYFTPSTIQQDEIWSGTYNRTRQMAQFFCNKNQNDSIIKPAISNVCMEECMPLTYLNGNVDHISLVCQGSCSIPNIINPCPIENDLYYDGGVYFASPMSYLSKAFKNQNNHYVYICGEDVNRKQEMSSNMLYNSIFLLSELSRNKIMDDRLITFQLLGKDDEVNHAIFPCTVENMKAVAKVYQNDIIRSMLEIYPTQMITLDITNFNGEDVVTCINEARSFLRCRFWWVGDKDALQEHVEQ